MPSLSAPPPRFLRDIISDVSDRLRVARTTGKVDGFIESMKELDTAWRHRGGGAQPADLLDMKAEMSTLFEELRALIEERASRHAAVVIRPRIYTAVKRTVPSWQGLS